MIRTSYIFILCFSLFLLSCKNSAKSEWSIVDLNLNDSKTEHIKNLNIEISEGSSTISGYDLEFSNLVEDSRETSMSYEVWKSVAFSQPSNEYAIAEKIGYFGKNAEVFHFSGEKLNKGFLVFSKINSQDVWLELWGSNGIKRVRLDFIGTRPKSSEANKICDLVSQLSW